MCTRSLNSGPCATFLNDVSFLQINFLANFVLHFLNLLYMENILNVWFSWNVWIKNTTSVQASQLYNVSTTKTKLVDCTRNHKNVMFYETWSTISKDLIISLSLAIPTAMVSFCHCLEFCFISDCTWEFCLFWGDIFGTLWKFYLRKELVHPHHPLKKNTLSNITYKNHSRCFPYF